MTFDLFLLIAGGFLVIYFFENIYTSYKRKKLEEENIRMLAETRRKEINLQIKEINDKIINKQEVYEKNKGKVYDIIKKRNEKNSYYYNKYKRPNDDGSNKK